MKIVLSFLLLEMMQIYFDEKEIEQYILGSVKVNYNIKTEH